MLERIRAGQTLTGPVDAVRLLRFHGRDGVADHVFQVAANADRLAVRYGVSREAALTAAWLHDVSLVLPHTDMVRAAEEANLEILPEERQTPGILHGKLSGYLARGLFRVLDPAILSAIECHTTLRANPSLIDKLLFVADKLSWDQQHAPFQAELVVAAERSLDEAVRSVLTWMWRERERMPVVHPWFRAAYTYFAG